MDHLAQLLEATVAGTPQQVSVATEELKKVENTDNFTIKLLEIIHSASSSPTLKHASALYFKNIIAKRWPPGSDNPISEDEKNRLKTFIIQLMVVTQNIIQKQLTEGLTIMSVHDFPQQWPNLIPELLKQLDVSQSVDFNRIVGTLKTLNSIVYRYRNAPNNEEVNIELKIILDALATPLLNFFQVVEAAVEPNTNNTPQLVNIFHCLLLISKIFYSLSYVDIPAHFEEELKSWMPIFQRLLNYQSNNKFLLTNSGDDDDDRAGPLIKLKIAIIEIIRLYVEKYESEIENFVQPFVAQIWALLQMPYDSDRYNRLVSVGINFLTIVCTSIFYKFFQSPDALLQICEKVIIPNMILRSTDEENFESDPVEYIRSDIEGSDADTRRRCAYNLVKGLRKHFQKEVTELFANYVTTHLTQYSVDPKKNWSSKNVSIYLVTALTISGETADRGTTRVNEFIPLLTFFQVHILPEFVAYPNNHPVIQSDALKFISSFRNILPEEEVIKAFPYIAKMLTSKEYVVSTYAANAIERLLYSQRVKKETLIPALGELYRTLFQLLNDNDSKDNEYLIKCIMRITMVAGGDVLPHAELIFSQLGLILKRIIEHPSNPEFNHYLFESLAAFIKSVYSPDRDFISPLESILLPTFQIILEKDLSSFTPYVFQIMAEMISYSSSFTQIHAQILAQTVMPSMWENSGNIPALVRLLKAIIGKGPNQILAAGKLEAVLGVFQKLLSSSLTDSFAFKLLEPIIDNFSLDQIKGYIPEIIKLFFTRIQKNKTNSFMVNFIGCISRMILRFGDPIAILSLFESVQPNISVAVVNNLWGPTLQHVSNPSDKKIIFTASARLLFCQSMLTPPLSSHAKLFYERIIAGLETPKKSSVSLRLNENNQETEGDDFENFKITKTSFVRLINALPKEADPFPDLTFDAVQFASLLKSQAPEFLAKLPPS